MKEFVATSQVAREAGVSSDLVRKELREGRLIPAARTASGMALFTRAQSAEWSAARKTKQTRTAA